MTAAIRINDLWKQYRIGHGKPDVAYRTLREAVSSAILAPWWHLKNRAALGHTKEFWALQQISFEVRVGEVIGIIGRNGAGKSTLLKILSRITPPSRGRVELRGRVASLLEVGTGFHQELTGRENIHLNGSILGMTRQEIRRKFDEIVEFSGVEQFLDTPVKRYSSGMRVRLAFAVAAHLDPEMLLIDEVLAVGDVEFQQKCLGKMGDVARSGRTVLFVSHNMAAISALCENALLLENGKIVDHGPSDNVVSKYLSKDTDVVGALSEREERGGHGPVRFTSIRILNGFGDLTEVVQSGQQMSIELTYHDERQRSETTNLVFLIFVAGSNGERLFCCATRYPTDVPQRFPYSGRVRCTVPKLPLIPGQYSIDIVCKQDPVLLDHVWSAKSLTVTTGPFFGTGHLPPRSGGSILVEHSWDVQDEHESARTKLASANLETPARESHDQMYESGQHV